MNPLLYLSCMITHSDREEVSKCNGYDKQTIVIDALALVTLATFVFVLWSNFFLQFGFGWGGFAVAFLITIIIAVMDQRMASSDLEVAGILRNNQPMPASWWRRLALRAGLAFGFAYCTAVGVLLLLFGDATQAVIQRKWQSENAVIESEYAQLDENLRAALVAPIRKDLDALNKQRDQALAAVATSQKRLDERTEAAVNARVEAGREAVGGSVAGIAYRKGRGPLYQEARRQETEADKAARIASDAMTTNREAVRDLDVQIEKKGRDLAKANAAYEDQSRALEKRKQHDPRYKKLGDDPLLRYEALAELEKDPVRGATVTKASWIAKLVLLGFEMSYLLIAVVFRPSSVYTARMRARQRREGAEVGALHGAELDELRRRHPPLRVVGRDQQ